MEEEYNQTRNSCEDFIARVRTDKKAAGVPRMLQNIATLVQEERETVVGELLGVGVGTWLFPGQGTVIGAYVGALVGKSVQERWR